MNDINFSEKLPDLLNGRLSAQEKERVEAAMSMDAELKAEYEDMLATRGALEALELQAIRNMVKQAAGKPEAKVVPMSGDRKKRWRWVAVAASLLVFLVAGTVWWMNQPPVDNGLIGQEIIPFSFPSSVKRTSGTEQLILYKEAAALRKQKNYQGAIEVLNNAPTEDTLVYNRSIFLKGRLEMDDQKFSIAIDLFQEYLALEDERYSDYAAFYLAEAYLEIGEKEQAKEQLELILNGRYTQKFKKGAKLLLEKLEDER